MIRRTIALLGGSLIAVALMASAASAQYADPGGTITVDDPNPSVGDTITVSGEGCEPNELVDVFLTYNPTILIGQTTANNLGQFSASVVIPGGVPAGPATITACDASITITIAGAATGVALPRTGSDSLPLARVAAVLVAAGGFLVLATRKRAARVSVDA